MTNRFSSSRWHRLLALSMALCFGMLAARAADHVDYRRDILPILSDNCYHCHGPDEQARKAGLRLDTREGAYRVHDGVAAIAPGKPAESELIRRITASDPDDLMPPPDSNRKLTPQQIETLRSWVAQGAEWGRHWSFDPMQNPIPPSVKQHGRARNEIDRFVLARLEQERIQTSPEARKETLIRRASLDLTGLPPTPGEVQAFIADSAQDAFDTVIDRLLASPRFGERMASEWLDLARYADTHGYQMDRYRPMWPYRDWVIKAFNENLPFDQFVTWQLAGDLLPNATKEQRLATAFNRLHMQNEEGGIVEEEYRVAYVVDRVNTFGTAFLGLTLDCSRCHDHKYDPITMRDYYSLFSFFQNIDESGQTVYFGDVMPVPAMLLSSDEQDARMADLNARIQQMEEQLPFFHQQALGAFEGWLKTRATAPESRPSHSSPPSSNAAAAVFPGALPGLAGWFQFDKLVSNQVANAAAPDKPAKAVEAPQIAAGRFGRGIELNGENGFTFPGIGHFTRSDPFSLALWLQTPSHAPRFVIAHHSKAPIDAGSRGYELLLENGRVAAGLHHMWPGNSLKIATRVALPTNEWVHVAMTYDGSSRAAGVRLFVNGRLEETEVIRDGLTRDITYAGGEPDLAMGHRFRDSGFRGGRVDEFHVFNRALTPGEIAHLAGSDAFSMAWSTPAEQLTREQRGALLDYYVANIYPPALEFAERLRSLRDAQNKLVSSIPEIMVMKEMADPKPAFLLQRGAYDAPGEAVRADTPGVLPPFPADQPRNRLGLARWLTGPDHPLLARVTVNRAWQMMFGRGLVETSDNFGSQGSQPTHPDLLDWLAREFIHSGWDLKRLLKLIATSATYRQSSAASADSLARDPENLLLARGPSRRLTAEMLRDQALAFSGLLVEKTGGPSVKPYQPEGLWEEIAMGKPRYDQGKGDDLYRRSLYTFWKRTVPHPAMITFDAAERNVCIVRRQQTSTPLQALALLNDTQIIEAARFLGQRMLKEGGTELDQQVRWAFQLVAARPPNANESSVLQRLFNEQREMFQSDPDTAAKLITVGEAVSDPALALSDLAAATILASALLNHDEAVMRR